MARIRTIKPEFADDEKLASISRDARLLFVLMWTHSDDFGVVKGNPLWLRSQIFPYDSLEPGQFEGWLDELVRIERIISFDASGEKFFYIKNFQKHQVINKPSKILRNPPPPDDILTEGSGSTPVGLPEDYAEEGKGREGKGREGIFSSDSKEIRLSELLLSLILNRNSNFKKPDVQKWASEIDKLLRIDKRTPEELESVIRWCQADEFWQNNILSTAKLRKQYDQLLMKMKRRKAGTGPDDRRKRFLGGDDG